MVIELCFVGLAGLGYGAAVALPVVRTILALERAGSSQRLLFAVTVWLSFGYLAGFAAIIAAAKAVGVLLWGPA